MKNLTNRLTLIVTVAIFLTSCSSGLNAQDRNLCNSTKVNDEIPQDLTRWWSPVRGYYFNQNANMQLEENLEQFIINDALYGIIDDIVYGKIIEILDEVGVNSSTISNADLKEIALTINNFDKSSKSKKDIAGYYSKQFDSMIRLCYQFK